jgi:2-C-methyl-D-erythritol 2,4-cyclodiphosphate synthase
VVNCDVTIHAQEPKLTPHKPAIRTNLAGLLGVDETAVNVKAKTGEHVGPVGRGEAIVCEAVVLVESVPLGI